MGPGWPACPVRSCPRTALLFVGRGGVQGSGEGLPRAACLYGGMSGMFGIWVFTSQGALWVPGVEICLLRAGGGTQWAWPGLDLEALELLLQVCSTAPVP